MGIDPGVSTIAGVSEKMPVLEELARMQSGMRKNPKDFTEYGSLQKNQ